MTRLHDCPDCACGPLGEAFAPRPATSSTWAREQALRAAEEAVRRAKESRKKSPQAAPVASPADQPEGSQ